MERKTEYLEKSIPKKPGMIMSEYQFCNSENDSAAFWSGSIYDVGRKQIAWFYRTKLETMGEELMCILLRKRKNIARNSLLYISINISQ